MSFGHWIIALVGYGFSLLFAVASTSLLLRSYSDLREYNEDESKEHFGRSLKIAALAIAVAAASRFLIWLLP